MQTFFLKVFDWIGGSMYVHVNVLYNPIINFDLNSASYIPIGGGVGLGISLSLLIELLKQLKENFLSHFFFLLWN